MRGPETWLFLIYLNYLISVADCCEFPSDWRGSWYLTGYLPDTSIEVTITHSTFSERGTCQLRSTDSNDRFLLYKQTPSGNGRHTNCYSCVIFWKRHDNILQYKQGECLSVVDGQPFDSACDQIDSQPINTLVRDNAVPIPCPEILRSRVPVQFSYSLVSLPHVICNNQTGSPSRVTSCASNTRATIHYEACPFDGASNYQPSLGVKEVQCLAHWEGEGMWYYMKYGDSYRCSRLEENTLSLSTDGKCTSISSFYSAPITISFNTDLYADQFNQVETIQPLCDFPDWFKGHTEGLSDLSGSLIYKYEPGQQQMNVYKKLLDGSLETLQYHTCVQKISDRHSERKFITKVVNGCSHGYQCVVLRKRADGIVDYHAGQITSLQENSCTESNLYSVSREQQLLIDPHLGSIECPVEIRGHHTLQSRSDRCPITADVGCDESHSLVNIKECDFEKVQLQCRASWMENSQNYMIMSVLAGGYNCLKFGVVAGGFYNHIDFGDCNYEASSIIPSDLPQPPYTLSASPELCGEAESGYENAKIITIQDEKGAASVLSNDIILTYLVMLVSAFSQVV